MITCLVAPEELAAARTEIRGEAYRHLFRARRLAVGERLRLADGRGGARWAEVERVDRSRAVLRLADPAPANEPPLRLELLVPAPRPERATWLVEKATELGVRAVRFLGCERGPRELGPARLARLERVAASALEQCHGSRLPEITGTHPFSAIVKLLVPARRRYVLEPKAKVLKTEIFEHEGGTSEHEGGTCLEHEGGTSGEGVDIALLVGPEGGWTEAELARLVELGCRPMGLGQRILRVETAALVAAARWLPG